MEVQNTSSKNSNNGKRREPAPDDELDPVTGSGSKRLDKSLATMTVNVVDLLKKASKGILNLGDVRNRALLFISVFCANATYFSSNLHPPGHQAAGGPAEAAYLRCNQRFRRNRPHREAWQEQRQVAVSFQF